MIQSVAAAFLLACVLPSLQAAKPAGEATEIGLLRHAYKTMAAADHDYKGHRIKAMHAIEAACDQLGTDIRGDGHGHEKQAVSDEQLKEARQMLEQARGIVTGRHEAVIVAHIDEAIKELDIALTIK